MDGHRSAVFGPTCESLLFPDHWVCQRPVLKVTISQSSILIGSGMCRLTLRGHTADKARNPQALHRNFLHTLFHFTLSSAGAMQIYAKSTPTCSTLCVSVLTASVSQGAGPCVRWVVPSYLWSPASWQCSAGERGHILPLNKVSDYSVTDRLQSPGQVVKVQPPWTQTGRTNFL